MLRRPFNAAAVLLLALSVLLVGCAARPVGVDPGGFAGTPLPGTPVGPRVIFPSVTVNVELARTEAEHEKGLGGHAPLGERNGMLFIFMQPANYAFWMKGMTFPLDMLWIDDGKVVYIARDAPSYPPNTPDNSLPIYVPTAAAKYVLEVNTGFTKKFGIEVGTTAEFAGV